MPAGILLANRYRLGRRLGAGGMAEVFLARDERLGKDVAIKLLPPYLSRDADALRRFRQEATAVAGLSHPNVVVLRRASGPCLQVSHWK